MTPEMNATVPQSNAAKGIDGKPITNVEVPSGHDRPTAVAGRLGGCVISTA